jgi:hypothetical protein
MRAAETAEEEEERTRADEEQGTAAALKHAGQQQAREQDHSGAVQLHEALQAIWLLGRHRAHVPAISAPDLAAAAAAAAAADVPLTGVVDQQAHIELANGLYHLTHAHFGRQVRLHHATLATFGLRCASETRTRSAECEHADSNLKARSKRTEPVTAAGNKYHVHTPAHQLLRVRLAKAGAISESHRRARQAEKRSSYLRRRQ